MSSTKVSAYGAADAIIEPKTVHLENEGHDSLDNFIRQAIGKEPILSFTRSGESPIQWIQLLHALDQQGNGKVSRGSLTDSMVEDNGRQQEHCNGISTFASKVNGLKKTGSSIKGCGAPAEVAKGPSEHMPTLKLPEAVVAFAQAAAKANGEPEKYLPGWPLLSPSKVRLQKCDKCSREFCSPINYRRHIRVHRRSLNVGKVSPKSKELLGAFWDKLCLDKAKELASFEDVKFEEVAGSSIIGALTSLLRKPSFSSLPQVYLKAGANLLDIVQGRTSKFPISSQELFSILDDASEKTFLCAGTAISLQRFVFDGEIGKIAMETKNLIACSSFLLEQKLIKAWLADMDAEALRCQKLLFEEEEAAQKRQAELLERKRMKKLKQKEQKTRQHIDVNNAGAKDGVSDPAESTSCPMETESSVELSEMSLKATESSLLSSQSSSEPTHSANLCMAADEMCYLETGDAGQNWEYRAQHGSIQRLPTPPCRPFFKPTRNSPSDLNSQVAVAKPIAMQKHNGYKDLKSGSLISSQKVWARKSKLKGEDEDRNYKEREKETGDRLDGRASCEVLIGSISVTLKRRDGLREKLTSVEPSCLAEETAKIRSTTLSKMKESMKFWKQMDREEAVVPGTSKSDTEEADLDGSHGEAACRILQDQSCLANGVNGDCSSDMISNPVTVPENADLSVPKLFSRKFVQAFLSQRWKEAVSADHVKLVLSPDAEACSQLVPVDSADVSEEKADLQQPTRSILCSSENRTAAIGSFDTPPTVYKPKLKAKPENGYRLKYIPKQRDNV